jgi:hypothetical protein
MPVACRATCAVIGVEVECELKADHIHEHEANLTIAVDDLDRDDNERETPFLVWWDNGGHAFVGSNKAVDTGRIGGWDD